MSVCEAPDIMISTEGMPMIIVWQQINWPGSAGNCVDVALGVLIIDTIAAFPRKVCLKFRDLSAVVLVAQSDEILISTTTLLAKLYAKQCQEGYDVLFCTSQRVPPGLMCYCNLLSGPKFTYFGRRLFLYLQNRNLIYLCFSDARQSCAGLLLACSTHTSTPFSMFVFFIF